MQHVNRDQLTPPLDLIWGLRDRTRRARRQGLNVEQVVRAAVELADAGGLAAVSMSRIAERVGFTTMATYRHVRNKGELFALMVEAAVGQPSTLEAAPDGWRPSLERWSWELQAAVRRHPWLVDLPLARMPFGPNRLAWLESGLRALADTRLDELAKAALLLLLNGYVFSEARLTAEIGADQRRDAPGDPAPDQGEMLAAIVDARRFPATRRALEAGIFTPSGRDRDSDFAFGLERILDGIAHLIDQRADGRAEHGQD
jgi:AcrR family transcriptional regulator